MAGKISGKVEGGGGGERDRPSGGSRPGGLARAWAVALPGPTSDRDPEFSSRSAAATGASAGGGRGEVEHPKGEDFGFGGWGVREDGERQRGGLGGRRDRIALPCASLQAGCEAVRVRQSQVEQPRRVGEPAGVEAGRAGGELAPQRSRFAAGPSSSPTAKRRSRKARCVGVEAQDLGGGGGADEGKARRSAPASGGSRRRKASSRASPAPAKNSGSPCPALPLARAQAGTGAGGGKACRSGDSPASALLAPASQAARERPRRGRRTGQRTGSRSARITWRMVNRCGALSARLWRNPPRLSSGGDVR